MSVIPVSSPLHFLNIEHILGPVSITEHISKDSKKHIYVFGDIHDFREGCKYKNSLQIDKYLQKLLDYHHDKVIDIFLEVPYLSKDSKAVEYEYREEGGYLFARLIQTFSNCLQVLKHNCKYKNSRFHYTDLRWMNIESFTNLQYLITKIESIAKDIEDFWDSNLSGKEAKLTLDKISKKLEKFMNVSVNFNIYDILRNTKIKKQIEAIQNPKIKDKLNQKLEWIIDNEELVNKGLETLYKLQYLTTVKGKKVFLKEEDSFNDLYDKLDSIHSLLLNYQVEFMDIFLLSRVFRSFKRIKNKYSEDPKYIIIYAGDDHANSYRTFLSDIGFKTVNKSFDENQCLDISSFKRPFFSKRF